MPINPRENMYEHADFLGLRNNVSPDGFDLGDLSVALNVDIDDVLNIHRRFGYSPPVIAGIDRDLWSASDICLGVGSNALKQVMPDYSTTTLRSGFTPDLPLSYVYMNDRVYYANGVENGCVDNGANRTWGLAVPAAPALAATSGTPKPGKYQVVVTYLRNDGQESGAGRASLIDLPDTGGLIAGTTAPLVTTSFSEAVPVPISATADRPGGSNAAVVTYGIAVSSIPVSTDPTVMGKAIYASTNGGKTFWQAGIIANATTTFTIASETQNAKLLQTQFRGPPPMGNLVGRVGSRLLVAKGQFLYVSEPYAPELFDLRKRFTFPDPITMLEGVEHHTEGCWVGTTKAGVWLKGDAPENWVYEIAVDYGIIPGTLAYMDGEVLGDGSAAGDHIAFFATERGLCIGMSSPAGKFQNLTQARFAYPIQQRGAGVVRRHRGTVQYLVSMYGAEAPGNTADVVRYAAFLRAPAPVLSATI